METYKGKEVPDINITKVELVPPAIPKNCFVLTATQIVCVGIDCVTCIFNRKNLHIGIEYLIANNYITKAEAMRASLDGNISRKESTQLS